MKKEADNINETLVKLVELLNKFAKSPTKGDDLEFIVSDIAEKFIPEVVSNCGLSKVEPFFTMAKAYDSHAIMGVKKIKDLREDYKNAAELSVEKIKSPQIDEIIRAVFPRIEKTSPEERKEIVVFLAYAIPKSLKDIGYDVEFLTSNLRRLEGYRKFCVNDKDSDTASHLNNLASSILEEAMDRVYPDSGKRFNGLNYSSQQVESLLENARRIAGQCNNKSIQPARMLEKAYTVCAREDYYTTLNYLIPQLHHLARANLAPSRIVANVEQKMIDRIVTVSHYVKDAIGLKPKIKSPFLG